MEMDMLDKRAERMLRELRGLAVVRAEMVSGIEIARRESSLDDSSVTEWRAFENGDIWAGEHRWWDFRFDMTAPEGYTGKQLFLDIRTGMEGRWDATNPQFAVWIDGKLRQAVDTNHNTILLGENIAPGTKFSVYMKAYGETDPGQYARMFARSLEVADNVKQLWYDLQVPLEAAALMEKESRARLLTLEAISDALNLLDLREKHSDAFYASVDEARAFIGKRFYEELCDKEPDIIANCIGHTHIDVAWRWDLEQTHHKAIRSFATVNELMDRYPEYKFMSSQPVLYRYVKKDCPELFEQIKKRVADGRWECEGGMWLEADCNLSGGEALVRQLLQGKEFFRKEFGKDNRILWLPDVFGYSAALPQLLKKSGIDYFMTTKLSWSEYNKTPMDTFKWKGLDGSEVLTHFIPARDFNEETHDSLPYFTTYNATINPKQIMGGWQRFQQKGIDNQFLVSYGFGDGGGGPTEEMLEYQRRMQHQMPGMPRTRQCTARDFFEALETRVSNAKRLPKWSGELYLEYHRGTYTAQAHNKRNNRKSELELRETELWCQLAYEKLGLEYPAQELHDIWEVVLTLQFHDILPGSSIRKVYEDSDKMYAECFEKLKVLKGKALDALSAACTGDVIAFNSLSNARDDVLWFDCPEDVTALCDAKGVLYPVQHTCKGACAFVKGVPAMGAKSFTFVKGEASAEKLAVSTESFETPFFRGKFDASANIASLIDLRCGREVAKAPLNAIVCYENKPHNYDAWDINKYYTERKWDVNEISRFEVVANGPVLAIVRIVRPYMKSEIAQDMILYKDIARIDFVTEVDWQEQQYMLKAHFPVDVFYNYATYDVQFGNVQRATHKNTSWDVARFESCHHKWMDVSEAGYGVSVLNDCKYGSSIDENSMALTLLKSSCDPDPIADLGKHVFTYSLMPHMGDWRVGSTVKEAYSLNIPMTAHTACGGAAADGCGNFASDKPNVIIEAVKQQLDGKATVVRLYECYGARTSFKLSLGGEYAKASLTNLLEQPEAALAIEDGAITLTAKPYEVITVMLEK